MYTYTSHTHHIPHTPTHATTHTHHTCVHIHATTCTHTHTPHTHCPQLSEENNGEDSDEDKQQKAYVPPKVAAVPYEDYEGGVAGRQRRMEERMKHMALRSELVKELRDEYLDIPQEIQVGTN